MVTSLRELAVADQAHQPPITRSRGSPQPARSAAEISPDGSSYRGGLRWHSRGNMSPPGLRNGQAPPSSIPPPPEPSLTSNLPRSFSRKDLKPQGWDRLVIHPDNRLKSYFESFIVVCVLYTAILEPIKVTYMVDLNPEVDVILDVIFFADLGIQFISGYHDSGGKRFPVLILRRVVRNYVNSWFLVDLVAAIPFDRFASDSDQDNSPLVRIPGLIKIVRLLKLRRTIRKWNSLSYGPMLKVLTIIGGWLLVAHWFGCIFFVLGWYTCPGLADSLEVDGPWVTHYFPNLTQFCITGDPPDTATFRESIGIDYVGILARCLYWALATMSSMGYGHAPVAHSSIDYLYSVFVQVCGACLAAGIFSNVAQMINQGDMKNARYQAQLDKVREFVQIYKVGPEVRNKLFGYSELLFSVNRGFDLHHIAGMFPSSVQQEVFYEEHRARLQQVPMFRGYDCDEAFLSAICRELRVQVVIDADYVFRAGEVGDRMYFLKTGYVQIYAHSASKSIARNAGRRSSLPCMDRFRPSRADDPGRAEELGSEVSTGECPEESRGETMRSNDAKGTEETHRAKGLSSARLPGASGGRRGSSSSERFAPDVVIATHGPGGYFGELSLFCGMKQPAGGSLAEEGGGSGGSSHADSAVERQNTQLREQVVQENMMRRKGSARALCDCILIVLLKEDFELIVERLRINAHRMMAVATEELKKRDPNVERRLTDLEGQPKTEERIKHDQITNARGSGRWRVESLSSWKIPSRTPGRSRGDPRANGDPAEADSSSDANGTVKFEAEGGAEDEAPNTPPMPSFERQPSSCNGIPRMSTSERRSAEESPFLSHVSNTTSAERAEAQNRNRSMSSAAVASPFI